MFYIYLVTCLANEKIYVGQTELTPEQRLVNHFYSRKKNDYFHAAIRKHGKESFVVQEIAQWETQEETDTSETLWISLLGSCDREIGYNTTYGGRYGGKPNEAARIKIGLASSQRTHSPETKEGMSKNRVGEHNSFYGKKHKPESIEIMKEKLRISLGGENNPWFGKTLTQEHRSNISKSKKGKKMPPRSEETCKKLSEAAKARWARYHMDAQTEKELVAA